METERPVHVVLTGAEKVERPLTADEWAVYQERLQAAAREEEEQRARRAADTALVTERAAQDPAFAALLRLLGLTL